MKRLISLSAGSKFTEYPPNCLQFKALCLAFYEELRLPKANEAFREIINQRYCFTDKFSWSHEVIKFVANRLPADFLMIEQEQVAFDLFKQAFDQVCSLVKQGHAIPNLPERLASRKPADKSVAHYHLQQIKQRLGVSR